MLGAALGAEDTAGNYTGRDPASEEQKVQGSESGNKQQM